VRFGCAISLGNFACRIHLHWGIGNRRVPSFVAVIWMRYCLVSRDSSSVGLALLYSTISVTHFSLPATSGPSGPFEPSKVDFVQEDVWHGLGFAQLRRLARITRSVNQNKGKRGHDPAGKMAYSPRCSLVRAVVDFFLTQCFMVYL
jgi:hypothetical protein